jgi:hypothetical protein
MSIQTLHLTGASILVVRGMKSLQAAPLLNLVVSRFEDYNRWRSVFGVQIQPAGKHSVLKMSPPASV